MTAFDLLNHPLISYLSHFRTYYPGILEWYSGLQQDLLTGRRSLFLSRKRNVVQGLAITKNGSTAKLCHISVLPSARGRGLGRTLMSLALSDVTRRGATEIHVTTGEEVYINHAEYFHGFGFGVADWQLNRYRKGNSELIWTKKIKYEPLNLERSADELHRTTQFYGGYSSFPCPYVPKRIYDSAQEKLWVNCSPSHSLSRIGDGFRPLHMTTPKQSSVMFRDIPTLSNKFWHDESCLGTNSSLVAKARANYWLLDKSINNDFYIPAGWNGVKDSEK